MMGLAARRCRPRPRVPSPSSDRRIDPAVPLGTIFTARGRVLADDGVGAGRAGGVDQVALRQDDQVGAGDLVLEHLLDRVVMVERGIGGALRGERVHVGGDPAFGQCRPVDHGDDAVDRHPALHRRPLERLHQRLGQRQARGLDQDVIDPRRPAPGSGRAPARNRRPRCSRCSHWRARRCSPPGRSRCRSPSGSRRRCRCRRTR